jgi:EmrB/QacA subfamily drug resistance transporter
MNEERSCFRLLHRTERNGQNMIKVIGGALVRDRFIENRSLQRNVLIVATLSSFLTPFMASSVVVSLPSIAHDLSMKVITLSWVSTAYLLAAAAFCVPFGRASDIYGRKKIFTYGIILDNLASILGACATSSAMLIVARVLQGIGGAMIFTLGVTIVTSVFPPEKRGKALGIIIGAAYVGLSAGPPIGGFLTAYFGWRAIFLSNMIIGLVILTTTVWKLKPEWTGARGERFDYLGSVVYVASLALLMYGLSEIPRLFAFFLVASGALGVVLFALWEGRAEHPVLETGLFRRNRPFLFSNLAALINYSATFSVMFLMSLYLHYVKGFSVQTAGYILMTQPVVQAAFSPLAGRMSDRRSPGIVASIGMALTVVGLSVFTCLTQATHLGFIILNLMLLGLGFALFASPNTNAVMSSVDKKHFGVAGGTLATMRVAGQMLSMGAVMLVFALFRLSGVIITSAYNAQFLRSEKTAFAVSAVLCAAGVLASLARIKSR